MILNKKRTKVIGVFLKKDQKKAKTYEKDQQSNNYNNIEFQEKHGIYFLTNVKLISFYEKDRNPFF